MSRIYTFLYAWLVTCSAFVTKTGFYSADLHLLLFLLLCLLNWKSLRKETSYCVTICTIYAVFVIMSMLKFNTLEHPALYFNYGSWPLVLFFVVQNKYKISHLKWALFCILLICCIGDLLTIKRLMEDPMASRLLAGAATEGQRAFYYSIGVGGFGHAYAMAFLTYGVLVWVKGAASKIEKMLLLTFLAVNSVLVYYTSYTTAIIIMLFLAWFAFFSGKKGTLFVPIVTLLLCAVFYEQILSIAYDLMKGWGNDLFAEKMKTLQSVSDSGSLDSWGRGARYVKSLESLINNPLTGSDEIGKHSQILDSLGLWGIVGGLHIIMFASCMSLCRKIVRNNSLQILYLIFFVLLILNPCVERHFAAMALFIIPLIIYILDRERQERNYPAAALVR